MKRIRANTEIGQEILDREDEILEGPVDFISTGCTTLNLAGSGYGRKGGWARGRIANVVGDGSSGKTLVALEFCALCFHKLKSYISKLWPKVKKVFIVYNNVEGVMDFPVGDMYGDKFNKAVEWIQIQYIEDIDVDLNRRIDALKKSEALIYVIDSWDAVDSKKDADKAEADMVSDDPKKKGGYGLGKQKFASRTFFRKLCNNMKGKDITLMIISQTRIKIDATFGKKKYRTGGEALNFYTHQVCWLYEVGKLTKTVLTHKRSFGLRIRARFERNKVAKPYREAEFTILFDYGIDDIRALIDWYYGPKKKVLEWDGEDYKREELIQKLEDNDDDYTDLILAVENRWKEIEEKLKPQRKPKYD